MSMTTPWEQWQAKRPAAMAATATAASATASASAAFQSLLRSSPLVAAAAESSAATATSASLKKMWDSARDITRNAVQTATAAAASPASSTTSTVASDLDALESGQSKRDSDAGGAAADANDDESATATWPLFRRKTSTDSSMLPAMSWNTRFKYFVGMTLMGLMFFGMASIFLPLIMIRPSKFALSFTFGSMCLMTAFAMLKGPAAFVAGLLEPKRLALTVTYFATLGATLYSCLVLGNYVFVVVSSVLQLLTLSAFAMSALPGGHASLSTLRMLFVKAARQLVQTLARLFR